MENRMSGFRVIATILCLQMGMAVGQFAEGLVTTTRSSSQSHPHDDDGRTLRLLLSSNDSADLGVHPQTMARVNLTSSEAVPLSGDEDNFSSSPFDEPTALMGELPLVTGPPRAVQTPGGGVIQDDSADPFQTTALPVLEGVESSASTTLKPSPDSSLVLARNSDGRLSLEERTAGPKVLGITTTWAPTTHTSDVNNDSTISAETSDDFTAVNVSTTHASAAPVIEPLFGRDSGNGTTVDTTTIPLAHMPVESSSHSLPSTTIPISIEESLTLRTLPPLAITTAAAATTTTTTTSASSIATTPTTSISISSTTPATAPVGATSGHTHGHQFTTSAPVTPLDSSSEDDNIIVGLNNNRSIFGEDTSSSSPLPAIVFHPVGDGNANGSSSTVWFPIPPVPTSHPHLIVEEISGMNATSQPSSISAVTTSAEEPFTQPSTAAESPNGVSTEQPILLHPTESEMPSSTPPPHGDSHSVDSSAATAPTHHHNASSTSAETLFDSSSVATPTMTTSTIIRGGEDGGSTFRGAMEDQNAKIIVTSHQESTTSKPPSPDPALTHIQSSTIIADQVSSTHHPIEFKLGESSSVPPITSSLVNDGATESHHPNEATPGIETTGHEPIATTLNMGIQDHDHQEATHAVASTSPPASTLLDMQMETTTEIPHSLWHSHHVSAEASPNAFKTSFSLRFPNIDFSLQFNDPESGMSRKLKEQITPELDDVLKKTIGEENYAGFHLTSARKGSLIVDGEILTRAELAADTSSIASRLEENIAAAGSQLGGNIVDIQSIKVNGILSRGPVDASHHLSHTTDSSTHTGYVVAGAVGIGILITVFAIFAVIVFGVNSRRAARRTLKMGEEIGMTERGQGVSCTRLGDGGVNFMSYGISQHSKNTATHKGGGAECSGGGASASNGGSPYISPMVLNGSQFTPPSAYKK